MPPNIARRRFLVAATGLGASLAFVKWRYASSPDVDLRAKHVHSRISHALGTKVSITVHHNDAGRADSALDAAFAAIEDVESALSIYRPDSQLSQLNQTGKLEQPADHLLAVLECAMATSHKSQGAFDITVQPLWEAFEAAQKTGRLPTRAELAEAREAVDWQRVQFDKQLVQLVGPKTQVTFNGIAQGYAADRALAAVRKLGIEHALIDTGELAALGAKADAEPWQVGIQHPRRPHAFISLARLQDRCLSTSGDYATSFSADHVHHHVFDPATGQSPSELASVSVAAPTAMQADAWSTALFVLGCKRGSEILASVPDHDAMFVLKDGRTLVTAGFPVADAGDAT